MTGGKGEETAFLTAGQLAQAFAAGGLSPGDVTAAALERAVALEPHLNAFACLDEVGARAAAAARDLPGGLGRARPGLWLWGRLAPCGVKQRFVRVNKTTRQCP